MRVVVVESFEVFGELECRVDLEGITLSAVALSSYLSLCLFLSLFLSLSVPLSLSKSLPLHRPVSLRLPLPRS